MGLLLTTIAGLVVWIVLWAIGVKSFDAFMITMLMVVIAATFRVFAPAPARQPSRRGRSTAAGARANAALTQGILRHLRREH